MKKLINYFLIFLIWIYIIPVFTWLYKIFTAEKSVNDCMITYVRNIKYNWFKKWYWTYDHIDIKKYKWDREVWKVKWCLFYWNRENYLNYSNTIYCSLAYLLL